MKPRKKPEGASKRRPRSLYRDTYRSNEAYLSDRNALLILSDKLGFPPSSVSMDECGCLSIRGKLASVYCFSDRYKHLGSFLVTVIGSPTVWAKKLGGEVRQNGEGEGVLLVPEIVDPKVLKTLLLAH